jgi:hypothetical protein
LQRAVQGPKGRAQYAGLEGIEDAAHLRVTGRITHAVKGAQIMRDDLIEPSTVVELQQRGVLQRKHRQRGAQRIGQCVADTVRASSVLNGGKTWAYR